jgi:hypothetical protein
LVDIERSIFEAPVTVLGPSKIRPYAGARIISPRGRKKFKFYKGKTN